MTNLRRTLIALSCAASALLAAPNGAFAVDRFVDAQTGSDANSPCSSQASPCESIGIALADAGPGDVVRVDDSSFPYVASLSLQGESLIATEFVGGDEGETAIASGGLDAVDIPAGLGRAGTISGFRFLSDHTAIDVNDEVQLIIGNTFGRPGEPFVGIDVDAGSPTISENLFVDSSISAVNDRGIIVDGVTGVTIVDNGFTNVSHPIEGGDDAALSNITVTRNDINGVHQRTFTGFGIRLSGVTNAVIEDNHLHDFAGSSTTGISVGATGSSSSSSALRRNRVFGAGNGIFISDHTSSTLTGDVIAGSADVGLQLFDDTAAGTGDSVVTNVTVANQQPAATADIAVNGSNADLTLDSSIVGDDGITTGGSATCSITTSRGPTTTPGGTGCANFQTSAVPQFVDAPSLDFRLTAANPTLIDTGAAAVPTAPNNLDLDGEKRAMDGDGDCDERRDIGADEYQPPAQDAAIDSGPAEGSTIATAGLVRLQLRLCLRRDVRVQPGRGRVHGLHLAADALRTGGGPAYVRRAGAGPCSECRRRGDQELHGRHPRAARGRRGDRAEEV